MLIEAENIGHFFRHKLFENISLRIDEGDFLAIYWPSGVGKTTLLSIFGNIIAPKIWSMNFHTFLTDRQKAFGYAFIGGPFFEELTVKENILFLENFSKITPNKEKYEEMMHFFHVKQFENTPIKLLSIGQRERINIIRAFVHEPKIIIIDEPWSNLDDANFDKLFAFLEKENREYKRTIIVATHDVRYKHLANKSLHLTLLDNE